MNSIEIKFEIFEGKSIEQIAYFFNELNGLLEKLKSCDNEKVETILLNDNDVIEIEKEQTPDEKDIEKNLKLEKHKATTINKKQAWRDDDRFYLNRNDRENLLKSLQDKNISRKDIKNRLKINLINTVYAWFDTITRATREQWQYIFDQAGLIALFKDGYVCSGKVELKKMIASVPTSIREKIEQQYYIDYELALKMSKQCKTVAECNALLDRHFKTSIAGGSSLNNTTQMLVD